MGAHADDPVAAVGAHLTRLEEEIDTLPWPPVCSAALAQHARPGQHDRQMAQRLIELADGCRVQHAAEAIPRKVLPSSRPALPGPGGTGRAGSRCRPGRLDGAALGRADG